MCRITIWQNTKQIIDEKLTDNIMEKSVAGRASMAELESRLSVILLWGLEGNQQTEQATEREGLFSNRAVWLGVIFSLTDVVNSQLFDRFTIRDTPHTPGHTPLSIALYGRFRVDRYCCGTA